MKIDPHMMRRVVTLVVLGAASLLVGGCGEGPPETSIDSAPDDPSNSGSANFSFSSNKENSTFECNRDGAGFITCTSPKQYADLSNGSHTFEVRAKADGQTDDSPSSYTWTVKTEPERATFEIYFLGFRVNNETYDHDLEVDGKGDEVFVRYDTYLIDAEENVLEGPSAEAQTKTMGDTNGYTERVQAGSRSDKGGLKSGDGFPSEPPWNTNSPLHDEYPRMELFRGTLVKGETGLAITPTIWEWDGNKDILQVWEDTMKENGPAIAKAVATIITGTPDVVDVYQSAFDMGIPATFDLIGDIFGRAENRPVGGDPRKIDEETRKMEFEAKTLVLTYDTAEKAAGYDFGHGRGVLFTRYDDPSSQTGSYTLFFLVRQLPNCPPICPD